MDAQSIVFASNKAITNSSSGDYGKVYALLAVANAIVVAAKLIANGLQRANGVTPSHRDV